MGGACPRRMGQKRNWQAGVQQAFLPRALELWPFREVAAIVASLQHPQLPNLEAAGQEGTVELAVAAQ